MTTPSKLNLFLPQPVGPALNRYVGNVWAPDLVYHNGRFYIYFPALNENSLTNMVVYADDIRGPWSEAIDLKAVIWAVFKNARAAPDPRSSKVSPKTHLGK